MQGERCHHCKDFAEAKHGPVVASGILAGRTGLTLEDYLSREKVPANFVFYQALTPD